MPNYAGSVTAHLIHFGLLGCHNAALALPWVVDLQFTWRGMTTVGLWNLVFSADSVKARSTDVDGGCQYKDKLHFGTVGNHYVESYRGSLGLTTSLAPRSELGYRLL